MKPFLINLQHSLVSWVVLLFIILQGQAANIDSLKNVVATSTDPVNKGTALLDLGMNHYLFAPDTAYMFWEQALTLAGSELEKSLNDSIRTEMLKIKGDALGSLGYLDHGNNRVEQAIKRYNESAEIFSSINDKVGSAQVYNNIGLIYLNDGRYQEALEIYDKCERYFREGELYEGVAMALQNQALIWKNYGKMEKAIDLYNASLRIRDSISDSLGLGHSYYELGVIHHIQEDYQQSKKYFLESIAIRSKIRDYAGLGAAYNELGALLDLENNDSCYYFFKKSEDMRIRGNDRMGLGFTYSNLGSYFLRKENYDSSIFYFNKGLDIRLEANEKKGISLSYFLLGNAYFKKGNLGKAQEYGSKGYNMSKEYDFMETFNKCSELLSEIYEKKGNHERALYFYKQYKASSDSLLNKETKRQAIENQLNFEYEKQKALDDKENEKRIAIAKEKQKKQFVVMLISLAAGLLVIILLLIIYRRLQITRRQKLIIQEQNENLNQSNEEISAQRDQIELQKNLIEEKHGEIQESINYARRIQTAILPPKNLLEKHLPNSFVLYKPKDVVAGDFYWLEATDEFIFFAVADCTGHGVPGAMVSVVCHGALNRCIREYKLTKPSDILDKTRELVIDTFKKSEEQVKDGMDISLCAIQKGSSKLSFAGANNPLYIVRRSITKVNPSEEKDNMEIIKADKEPIGFVQHPTPFTNHELQLEQGDVLYLFSDGYADQFGGPKGKKMGYKKFRELLIGISNKEMEGQQHILDEKFVEWKGREEQIDDVCVIGIKH